MADIFLSYASTDRKAAQSLAQRLAKEGWSVWWDRRILPGKLFDNVIEEELSAAKCIVVLWSKASVESDWVRAEAEEGKERGSLVPVLIEEARIPLPFRRLQAANIIGWENSEQSTDFNQFLEAIRTMIMGAIPLPGPLATRQEAKKDLISAHHPGDESGSLQVNPQPSMPITIRMFAIRTHEKWLSGRLSHLSPTFQESSLKEDVETFSKGMETSFGEMLKAILRIATLVDDEFLVGAGAPSFFLTNRVLYVFSQNEVNGPIMPIRLNDIKQIKSITGWWRNRLEVTLKAGEVITIRGLEKVPKEEYIYAFNNR